MADKRRFENPSIVVDAAKEYWGNDAKYSVTNKRTRKKYKTNLNLCIGDECEVNGDRVLRVILPSSRKRHQTYANFVAKKTENQLAVIREILPIPNSNSKMVRLFSSIKGALTAEGNTKSLHGMGVQSVVTTRTSPRSRKLRINQSFNPSRNNSTMPSTHPGVARNRIVRPKGLTSSLVTFTPYRQKIPEKIGGVHDDEATIKVAVGTNVLNNVTLKDLLKENLRPFIHIIQGGECTYQSVFKPGQPHYGQTVYTEGIIFTHTDERWEFRNIAQVRPRFVIYIPEKEVTSVTIPDPVYMSTMTRALPFKNNYDGNDVSMQVRLLPFRGVVFDVQKFGKRLTIHVLWTSMHRPKSSKHVNWTCN